MPGSAFPLFLDPVSKEDMKIFTSRLEHWSGAVDVGKLIHESSRERVCLSTVERPSHKRKSRKSSTMDKHKENNDHILGFDRISIPCIIDRALK